MELQDQKSSQLYRLSMHRHVAILPNNIFVIVSKTMSFYEKCRRTLFAYLKILYKKCCIQFLWVHYLSIHRDFNEKKIYSVGKWHIFHLLFLICWYLPDFTHFTVECETIVQSGTMLFKRKQAEVHGTVSTVILSADHKLLLLCRHSW